MDTERQELQHEFAQHLARLNASVDTLSSNVAMATNMHKHLLSVSAQMGSILVAAHDMASNMPSTSL
jgi:hypothetical protein